MVVVIWVLDTAVVVVTGPVSAGFIVVVDCDVAAEQRGSELETRGCGGRRGAVGRLCSECRRL